MFGMLLRALISWCRGGRHVWSVVSVPSIDEEDVRRSHRERGRLIHERTSHINRIKGLLFAQGIRDLNIKAHYGKLQLDQLVTGDGRRLPPRLVNEIAREIARLALLQEQIAIVDRERDAAPTPCKATEKKRIQLTQLKGIGPAISAIMSREVYYRQFNNRRQVAGFLGLATSPYDSGDMERSQGISRTGRGQVPKRARQTDHDRRGRAQVGDRVMAICRAGSRSSGRRHRVAKNKIGALKNTQFRRSFGCVGQVGCVTEKSLCRMV
jgi:transposase